MNAIPFGQASEEYLEKSLNRLFENFELNDSNNKDVIRSIVELTFFEKHIRNFKENRQIVLCRVRQILSLGQNQEIPKQFEKQVNDELSSLGRRTGQASKALIQYLVAQKPKEYLISREKGKIYLPIPAFSGETKKRIFHYFSSIIREELREIQEMRNQLVYPDKAIKSLNDMLHELARQFNIREPVNETERLLFLRASFGEAKARYNDLKEQLQDALQSEDTARLENRLKKAQDQVSTLASEIQKLELNAIKH